MYSKNLGGCLEEPSKRLTLGNLCSPEPRESLASAFFLNISSEIQVQSTILWCAVTLR